MEEREFEFYGVDLKRELKAGALTGIAFIAVWSIVVFIYYTVNHLGSVTQIPRRVFLGGMFLGIGIALMALRMLGIMYRHKWKVKVSKDKLLITFNKSIWNVLWRDVCSLGVQGGPSIRYLTIHVSGKSVKIRVGANLLVPFSQKNDIQKIDECITVIGIYLSSNGFVKRDRRKDLSSNEVVKFRYLKKPSGSDD